MSRCAKTVMPRGPSQRCFSGVVVLRISARGPLAEWVAAIGHARCPKRRAKRPQRVADVFISWRERGRKSNREISAAKQGRAEAKSPSLALAVNNAQDCRQ